MPRKNSQVARKRVQQEPTRIQPKRAKNAGRVPASDAPQQSPVTSSSGSTANRRSTRGANRRALDEALPAASRPTTRSRRALQLQNASGADNQPQPSAVPAVVPIDSLALRNLQAAIGEFSKSLPDSKEQLAGNDVNSLVDLSAMLKNLTRQVDAMTLKESPFQMAAVGPLRKEDYVLSDFKAYRTCIYVQALKGSDAFVAHKNVCEELKCEIDYDEFQYLFYLFYNGETNMMVDISTRPIRPQLSNMPQAVARNIFERLNLTSRGHVKSVSSELNAFMNMHCRLTVEEFTVDIKQTETSLICEGRTVDFEIGNHLLDALEHLGDILIWNTTVFNNLKLVLSSDNPPEWDYLIPTSNAMQAQGLVFRAKSVELEHMSLFTFITCMRLICSPLLESLKITVSVQPADREKIPGHIRDLMANNQWKKMKKFDCDAELDAECFSWMGRGNLECFIINYSPDNDEVVGLHQALLKSDRFKHGVIAASGPRHDMGTVGAKFRNPAPRSYFTAFEIVIPCADGVTSLWMKVEPSRITFGRLQESCERRAFYKVIDMYEGL